MNGLLLLSIGFSALIGALCAAIYMAINRMSMQVELHQRNLDRMDLRLNEQAQLQLAIQKRLDQLAIDVLQREIYQNADERHHLAIQDAKRGRTRAELISHHGLSSDEAALILSLHTAGANQTTRSIEVNNANLRKPESAGGI